MRDFLTKFVCELEGSLPKNTQKIFAILLFLAILLIAFYNNVYFAPSNFPTNSIYTVEKGKGLAEIANELKDRDIIRFKNLFVIFSILQGGEKKLQSGDYLLDQPESIWTISRRIVTGDYYLQPFKFVVPEGLNIFELADYLAQNFDKIEVEEFIDLAKEKEGRLFPDTYFFLPNAEEEEIIERMEENFDKKVSDIKELMESSEYGFEGILTMASIIEEEAIIMENKQIVAGILWERIRIDMPLQVDASFKYVNGETTFDLSLEDLKIESPYNTYINKGLPPTPIANPGLDSIVAALTPTETNYLYYLTGRDRKMYYAETFEQHKANKFNYLK